MRTIKKNYIFITVLILCAIFGYTFFQKKQKMYLLVTSYDACIEAGYEVSSTYPEVCKMPGKNFLNPNQKIEATATTTEKILELTEEFLTVPYIYNGEVYRLSHEGTTSSTSATPTFTYTGNTYSADVNRDKVSDTILLLTFGNSSATTTRSYYLTTAIKLFSGVVGSNIIFVDKNISIPNIIFKNGMIHLTYKKNAEATTTEKHYIFENDILKVSK